MLTLFTRMQNSKEPAGGVGTSPFTQMVAPAIRHPFWQPGNRSGAISKQMRRFTVLTPAFNTQEK